MFNSYTLRDAQEAFADAIASGRLSDDPRSTTYAGDYMYMSTGAEGRDQFKHCHTRRYLPYPVTLRPLHPSRS